MTTVRQYRLWPAPPLDALATKRATTDSYGVSELDGFFAAKASTAELDAAITTLDDATTTRLTGKLDKAAAYTSTEVDQ